MTYILNLINFAINQFKQTLTQKYAYFQTGTVHKTYSDIIPPKFADTFQAIGVFHV